MIVIENNYEAEKYIKGNYRFFYVQCNEKCRLLNYIHNKKDCEIFCGLDYGNFVHDDERIHPVSIYNILANEWDDIHVILKHLNST